MNTNEADVRGDGRVILDTTVSVTHVASIGAMNGHEGDNGRLIHFVAMGLKGRPYNLEGKTIDLAGTDAAGKVKIGGHYQPVDPAVGTFDFIMPGAFYQQTGDYAKAYFRIKDSNDQVVSTINVAFTVVAGVGFISSGDSKIYDGYVDDRLKEIEEKVKSYTEVTQKLIDGNEGEVKVIRSLVDNMLAELKNNQAALLGANNDFTGNNHFAGTTTIDDLKSASVDNAIANMKTQFDSLSNAVTQAASKGQAKFTDTWSRDYTWGPGLSKPNNDNDFALSRFMLADNLFMIIGRGDVKITGTNQDYWESSLTIPWKVNSATMMLADLHSYQGYFKPYHPLGVDNIVHISCSGKYSGDVQPLSLLMIGIPA